MIDFFRVQLDRDCAYSASLKQRGKNNVIGKHDCDTGEGLPFYQTKIDNLYLKITEKQAVLEGSLHKFFNLRTKGEEQNYDDFSRLNLEIALDLLEENFSYELADTLLSSLEFGFNIEVDKKPTALLR